MGFGDQITGKQTPPPPSARFDLWLPPDAVIAAMANDGDPVPTGWAPLDRQLRGGGIPPGRVVVIGGPPFSGKTTVVCAMALEMSKRMPVFALFSDEGRTQAAVRFAVMLGIPLAEIDANPSDSSLRLKEMLGERSIYLLKPDTDESYADNVVAKARALLAPGEPALIVLDSVQTVLAKRPDDTDAPESPRLAAKRLVMSCRSWADESRFTFLLTSQANRAFYRSKKDDENSAAIAAFSESGAIEYMADVALVLSLPDEESEIVKVRFVKNRLKGTAKSFQQRYSEDMGQMVEVDDLVVEDAAREAAAARLAPIRAAVMRLLGKSSEGLSTAHLAEMSGKRKADIVAAIQALEGEKLVFSQKSSRQILWFQVAGR